MSEKKEMTMINEYRSLTDEELSVELTPALSDEILPLTGKDNRMENEGDETGKAERPHVFSIGAILLVLSLIVLPFVLTPIGVLIGYTGYLFGFAGILVALTLAYFAKRNYRK